MQAVKSENPNQVIRSPMNLSELTGESDLETISEKIVNSKVVEDSFKTLEINPENIQNNLVYDFMEVSRCHNCEEILNQHYSYFYLKCLMRKLDCLHQMEGEFEFRQCSFLANIFCFKSFYHNSEKISCFL